MKLDLALHDIATQERKDAANDLVEVECLAPGHTFGQEIPQAQDHVAGALPLLRDVFEDLPDHRRIRLAASEEKLARLGIRDDRGEGLTDLVGQGGREISRCRQAARVLDLAPELLDLRTASGEGRTELDALGSGRQPTPQNAQTLDIPLTPLPRSVEAAGGDRPEKLAGDDDRQRHVRPQTRPLDVGALGRRLGGKCVGQLTEDDVAARGELGDQPRVGGPGIRCRVLELTLPNEACVHHRPFDVSENGAVGAKDVAGALQHQFGKAGHLTRRRRQQAPRQLA